MNSDVNDRQSRPTIDDQAIDWFVRHRSGDMSLEDEQTFQNWLLSSKQHMAAYLRLAEMQEQMQTMSAVLAPARTSRPFIAKFIAGGAIACAVALIVVIWRYEPAAPSIAESFEPVQSFDVPPGQQRTERLADGTLIQLNAGAALKAHYSNKARQIQLERGQALFTVAHDPERRFTVRMAYADITALGTEFDVHQMSSLATVTVVEGKVQLTDRPLSESPTTQPVARWASVEVSAGNQATLIGNEPPRVAPIDVAKATAWTQRSIHLVNKRLADVAAEFNRRNTVKIIIESPEAGERLVTGIFQDYNLKPFVSYLHTLRGLEVRQDAKSVRVRSRHDNRQPQKNPGSR